MTLATVWHRTYADFLMGDRLEELERLLCVFLEHGYRFTSVLGFWERLQRGESLEDAAYVILRHDVDSDPLTARRMWRLEQRLGISSSYYFRLCTLDVSFMGEIEAAGGEASYHYEELASYAKATGITSREELEAALPRIRNIFRSNLLSLRERTGLPMRTVASHGDFVNRKLGITNTAVLQDPELRRNLNITLEAYDEYFLQHISARASDAMAPVEWNFNNPYSVIDRRESPVLVLIHPRQWHANAWINFELDVTRCWEGFRYGWASRRKAA